MNIEELKGKKGITRDDIESVLESIGAPGEKRQEKVDAIKQLGLTGGQGVPLESTLDSYRSF